MRHFKSYVEGDAKLPLSRATNGYELLEDVIRCAEDEPRRLYMRVITERVGDWEEESDAPIRRMPPCGTLGCIAGWTNILAGNGLYMSLTNAALTLVGRHDVNAHMDLMLLFTTDYPTCNPGTKAYVKHVVTRIRAYMEKYEKTLKATKVKVRT